ncbi:hypothetical protein APHAL10511_001319 [Amanita phalloides]|nr:hypothetical protein APHAL10511_001319 [Amanita phalloides]
MSEVEILETTNSNSFLCQICFKDIDKLSEFQRQEHYETHFQTSNSGSGSGIVSTENPRNVGVEPKLRKAWRVRLPCNSENDVFWYSALSGPPPSNYTPGLVPLLKKGLHLQGQTLRGVLCHPLTVHVHTEAWDRTWGCGYRNYLMMCSALLSQQTRPEYHTLIRHPGVRNLQRLIKEAWDAGFDPEGREQLKELVGTSKWIGTADLYVAFTFCGIPCELVEFDLTDTNTTTDSLVNWVVDRFSPTVRAKDVNQALHRASAVTITDQMPLVLQHNGHSRTIIGYEAKRGSTNLLVFDPSSRMDSKLRSTAIGLSKPGDTWKRPIDESPSTTGRPDPPKHLRSTLRDNEPIDVDILGETSADVHIGGGTRKLLPSDDKVPMRLLKYCRLVPRKLRSNIKYFIFP